MQIEKTALEGVLLITPPTIFEDFRGIYVELYNKELYKELGVEFLQDDISTSYKNVLRGIHGNNDTYKLVSCLYGSFYLVVVNNDPESKQYKKWCSFTLSDRNHLQVLIPPKFGNGHLVLTDIAIFHYKQNTQYNRESQFTLKWDNPELNIFWPINDPILSERDSKI
jgi:dTDP-4-dehydrorhamnose 3,5-epimerase